ncbi:MAG: hypothetical protein GY774_37340 [Planctomycetes bacterium]|nr:hypothetical protein [Planctomycetota bacterium]
MQTQSRRIFPRNQYEAPLQYLSDEPDRYYNSRMFNFSHGGLYFEPFQSLEPKTQIQKDGVDFAMLFTLRESRRTSDPVLSRDQGK